ncbi:MAG: hypothetical protein JSR76_06215 [Verrucomicrobia bacterium]|nr:hypothetical protein [Verrucomicrobiota bacterium]
MQFYLKYQGKVSTRGHTKQKFEYRRNFLSQLKRVHCYLDSYNMSEEIGFCEKKIRKVGPFTFLPLVTKQCQKVVDLDLTILSHMEPCCKHNYPTGDIDNLLKVLLDGLRMPQNSNEIRKEEPLEGESPFYCLLEDDQFIRNIQVRHDKLFFPLQNMPSEIHGTEVFVIIRITTFPKIPLG